MGVKERVKQALARRENRHYERLLERRMVPYAEWIAMMEVKLDRARAETENAAVLRGGEPQLVVCCAAEGKLSTTAYKTVRDYFAMHPEVELLYGDEDICDERQTDSGVGRNSPWFKPDWSPDLLDSIFYFGSVAVMRQELFRRTIAEQKGQEAEKYGLRRGECVRYGVPQETALYEAVDFDAYEKWVHKCIELAGGYEKGSRCIGHLPQILFHCSGAAEQEKFLRTSSFLKQKESVLRDCLKADAGFSNNRREMKPQISVIIPSKDQPDLLEKCLRGCILAANGQTEAESASMEIIIVDNGSGAHNRRRIQNIIQEMREGTGHCGITYLYRQMEFNFSAMCNLGAAEAAGKYLFFLNDDVELREPGCMAGMAALAARRYTGAVGMKLYYPDSVRIQHAGITNLPMGPVHKLLFLQDDKSYYYGMNRGRRNVLAVTAACLMVEREKYEEADGFSEELKVTFNDVDFCFRLHELGYRNVCRNDFYAYHHESLSRGRDESAENVDRLVRERETLYRRHPQLAQIDPYYSVFLNREEWDSGVRPIYLTAGNETQRIRGQLPLFRPDKYRRDDCLMVRINEGKGRRLVGYGIVLGDDNACYERALLLWKERERGNGGQEKGKCQKMTEASCLWEGTVIYSIRLQGQYRPDLQENMPDQVHVALSGFDVEVGTASLSAGRWRVGLAARNRVTGLKLLNWSNCFLCVD